MPSASPPSASPPPASPPLLREPLRPSGALQAYARSVELTPLIGDEFPDASLAAMLAAPDADALLRDLAIRVSRRGVVFFRAQDLTTAQQKDLAQRLGALAGKPASSTLHTHPLQNAWRADPRVDDVVSVVSSAEAGKYGAAQVAPSEAGPIITKSPTAQWHTDIVFENVPSDYAVLHMRTVPPVGGDTLWATTYGLYDQLGPRYARFLEGLTARYAVPGFQRAADQHGFALHAGPRGSPANTGAGADDAFASRHPLVRTNPVTGWKAVYGGTGARAIDGLTDDEARDVLAYLRRLLLENHELQVRFKWRPRDVAIWDNRSTLHTATSDLDLRLDRTGYRVLSIGETPYLDPSSTGRHEALRLAGQPASAAS